MRYARPRLWRLPWRDRAVMQTFFCYHGKMQTFFLTLRNADVIYRKSWPILAEDKGNMHALLRGMGLDGEATE
jgi:hypothetical protein